MNLSSVAIAVLFALPLSTAGAQSVETLSFSLFPTMLAGDGALKSCGLRMIGSSPAGPDGEIKLVDGNIALGVDFIGMGKAGAFSSTKEKMKEGVRPRHTGSTVKWIKVGDLPALMPTSGPNASLEDTGYAFFGTSPVVALQSLDALADGGRLRIAFGTPKSTKYIVYAGPTQIDKESHTEFMSCFAELLGGIKLALQVHSAGVSPSGDHGKRD